MELKAAPLPEGEAVDQKDWAGILGILLAAAAVPCTMLGVMMPLIPWILSGVLGIGMILCGVMAHPPLRKWILGIGFLCMIPPLLLLLVQSIPSLANSINHSR
jgi:hypothetical protein